MTDFALSLVFMLHISIFSIFPGRGAPLPPPAAGGGKGAPLRVEMYSHYSEFGQERIVVGEDGGGSARETNLGNENNNSVLHDLGQNEILRWMIRQYEALM